MNVTEFKSRFRHFLFHLECLEGDVETASIMRVPQHALEEMRGRDLHLISDRLDEMIWCDVWWCSAHYKSALLTVNLRLSEMSRCGGDVFDVDARCNYGSE